VLESFYGRHDHTIDNKGRLSVPATYRAEILRRSEMPSILTSYDNHLALYPREYWREKIEGGLAKISEWDKKGQAFRRLIVGGATECPVDSQGRILIPSNLREHAKLESKVTLVGVLDFIEIWDSQLCGLDNDDTRARLAEIQRSLVDKGSDA
jgi:MraZ protein